MPLLSQCASQIADTIILSLMVSKRQHRQSVYDGDVDAAELVVDFVNTLDVSTGEDALGGTAPWPTTLGDASIWTAADRADLTQLREALRAELLAHHGGRSDPSAGRAIEGVAARHPFGLSFGDAVRLQSRTPGAGDVVAGVVDAMLTLVHEQRWFRVRVCPADDCLEAYYDASRGGTRRWCSMGVCGNRAKVKTYRERGIGAATPPGADRSG